MLCQATSIRKHKPPHIAIECSVPEDRTADYYRIDFSRAGTISALVGPLEQLECSVRELPPGSIKGRLLPLK